MNTCLIPQGYRPPLCGYDMQRAIEFVKSSFQENLKFALNLRRVSAPLFVDRHSGLNDNLNGVERPVGFDIPAIGGAAGEVVHSLAKWKRAKLGAYDIAPGFGLYTDMNAIRTFEELDNLHSLYVDQWDWEKTITEADRNLDYLKTTAEKIYNVVREIEKRIYRQFPHITPVLPEKLTFIHSEELLQRYPDLTSREREAKAAKEYGAIFLIGIGAPLSNGEPHDGRAPDYDDWITPNSDGYTGLNGDLIFWDPVLETSFELSSMGIRVSPESLQKQLEQRGCTERSKLKFHKALLENRLPLSIGGGIGQSRLCMFILQKAHIGEVQASIWPEEQVEACRAAGINLL